MNFSKTITTILFAVFSMVSVTSVAFVDLNADPSKEDGSLNYPYLNLSTGIANLSQFSELSFILCYNDLPYAFPAAYPNDHNISIESNQYKI